MPTLAKTTNNKPENRMALPLFYPNRCIISKELISCGKAMLSLPSMQYCLSVFLTNSFPFSLERSRLSH